MDLSHRLLIVSLGAFVLMACGGSQDSVGSGTSNLDENAPPPAAPAPVASVAPSTPAAPAGSAAPAAPQTWATSCTLTKTVDGKPDHATLKGSLKVNADGTITQGSALTMAFEDSSSSYDLTVQSGAITDIDKQIGDLVVSRKMLGFDVITVTLHYDGSTKQGTSKSFLLGNDSFGADCTFTK